MSGVRVPSAALEDVRDPAYALRPALHGCTSGEVAQLVEHRIENAGVGGSSPPLATSDRRPSQKGRRFAFRRTEPVLGRVSTRGGIMLLNGVMQL